MRASFLLSVFTDDAHAEIGPVALIKDGATGP
jgi:hypothetical protein